MDTAPNEPKWWRRLNVNVDRDDLVHMILNIMRRVPSTTRPVEMARTGHGFELGLPPEELHQPEHGCVAIALHKAVARHTVSCVKVEGTCRPHRPSPHSCVFANTLTIDEQPRGPRTHLRDQRCKRHDC